VTYIARNIEMDLRYITWIDHDRGASFVPIVSESVTSLTVTVTELQAVNFQSNDC